MYNVSSHNRANTAIALLVAAITPEARLLDRLDGLLDGRAGAGGWEGEVDGGGEGGGAHFGVLIK